MDVRYKCFFNLCLLTHVQLGFKVCALVSEGVEKDTNM